MLKLKEKDLQYIYQDNEARGVILDIRTFNSLMELLEDYEDSVEFERLKDEESMDYDGYRMNRLKLNVQDQD